MVNIPFVSEEFQRSFRNQFPSQTQTGRDLHVSDIVIPVVDFTPTTSGASLPQDLRFARNPNTKNFESTSSATRTTVSNASPGFNLLDIKLSTSDSTAVGYLELFDGTSTYNIISYVRSIILTSGNLLSSDKLIVYIPTGYSLLASTTGTSFNYFAVITLVADVDGNQILPFGYDPQ